jgi:hypothetical protein
MCINNVLLFTLDGGLIRNHFIVILWTLYICFTYFIIYNNCVSQFFLTVTKCLRSLIYKEERFILAHSLEISVHDCLALLFWACGKIAHHGESMWQRKLLIFWQLGNKEREETNIPQSPINGIYPVTWDYFTRLHLLKVPPTPNSNILGTKPLTFNTWAFVEYLFKPGDDMFHIF